MKNLNFKLPQSPKMLNKLDHMLVNNKLISFLSVYIFNQSFIVIASAERFAVVI